MKIYDLCEMVEEFAEMMEFDRDHVAGKDVKQILSNLLEEFADIRDTAKEIIDNIEEEV